MNRAPNQDNTVTSSVKPVDRKPPGRRGSGSAHLARDVGYILCGKYGQYAITLVTVPLTARVLGPEGTGLLAIAMSAYFFGSAAVDLGLSQILGARVHNHPNLGELRGIYITIRLAVLALLLAPLGVATAVGAPRNLEMALLGLAVGGLSSVGEEWVLMGRGQFGRLAVFQMSARVIYLLGIVLIVPRDPHAFVPVLLLAGSNLLASMCTWASIRHESSRPSFSRAVGWLLRLGRPVVVARLLITTYGQGAALVYSGAISVHALGIFSASDRLVRAVQSAFDSVGIAMMPRLARDSANPGFWRKATSALLGVVVLATGVSAVIFLLAPRIVGLLYGSSFAQAVGVLRLEVWLLPATAASSFVTTAVLSVLSDTRSMLIGSLIGAAATGVGLLLASATGSIWTVVMATVIVEWSVAGWLLLRMLQHKKNGVMV